MKKSKSIGQEMIDDLKEVVEHLENGNRVEGKYTVRTVDLNLRPKTYGAKDVKAIRARLCMSQAIFAKFLGASVKTIQAWEQGTRKIDSIASRFLDEITRSIDRDPAYMLKRLAELSNQNSQTAGC